MVEYQDRMYSDGREGLLIVIQAMDAAGKDGAIKHIFTAFNPAGVLVPAFACEEISVANASERSKSR